jgi:MFS family permease
MDGSSAQFLILFLLFIAALTGSINLPGWYDLVSKITPVRLRGRLFALRSILGGLLGMAGGYIVSLVLDEMTFPDNFALLFLMAFTMMTISYFFVMLLREKHPNSTRETYSGKDYWKHLLHILKEKKHFRAFLVADALMMAALMADAFYTVNALKKFSLSEGHAGFFLMVMMISMILGNLLFGYLADRYGHKKNLQIAAASSVIICLIAVWAPVLEVYYLVFVGAAITTSLIQLSRLAIVVELCAEEERPVYIALTNMITAPFILTGLLGGFLADYFGYVPVFLLSAFFALTSLFWYWRRVPEPRAK